jgi:hypothetical protein
MVLIFGENTTEVGSQETLNTGLTPLARSRERGWGRGRMQESENIQSHSLFKLFVLSFNAFVALPLPLSRKRARGARR